MSNNKKITILLVSGIGLLVAFYWSRSDLRNQNDGAATAAHKDSVPCITIGQICRLADAHVFTKDTTWIPVATSLEAYTSLHKAIRAGDITGIQRLTLADDVLQTRVGDEIRILDISVLDGWIEGRMTSGQYNGTHIWATSKWVIPK